MLYQVEFINIGSLSRDSAFNITVWRGRKGSISLVGWLAETWANRWPTTVVYWKCGLCLGLL